MTPLSNLAYRLLASIENHGKSNMTGIYKLYPHETKRAIDNAIKELDVAGWIIYRETQTVEGFKKDIPSVRRSKKQYYNEQQLFNSADQ